MDRIKTIAIGRDGWPVEFIVDSPIRNFFRRIILTHHYECRECWYRTRREELEGKIDCNAGTQRGQARKGDK